MFIRKKKRPQHTDERMSIAVQIVESQRDGNDVRQRVILHVGLARSESELTRFMLLAEAVLKGLESEKRVGLYAAKDLPAAGGGATVVDITRFEHVTTVSTGVTDVYAPVYDGLGLSSVLPRSRYRASNRALYDTVMARLGEPLSKRASAAYMAANLGSNTSLGSIYRMMDHLDDKRIEKARGLIAQASKNLVPEPISLLFFDCTTLYFESVKADERTDEEPGLRHFGYSKDGKSNRVQVVLALVVNEDGLPVTYELFPGNLSEGKTLEPVLTNMAKEHGRIKQVIVADAGMLSKDNRKELNARETPWILGARLRNLSDAQTESLLSHDWEQAPIHDWQLADNRRLVVWHSAKRAARDRKMRERSIEKLKGELEKSKTPKSFLAKRGNAAKFLKIEGESSVELNESAIEDAARWDGLSGVETNQDLDMETVREQYHGLWQVERSFRINKHTLAIRPIFHWTQKRIRAHVLICYMAFACLRHVEYRLRLKGVALSPERIRKGIDQLHDMVFCDRANDRRFAIAAKATADAAAIARAMQLKRKATPRPMD